MSNNPIGRAFTYSGIVFATACLLAFFAVQIQNNNSVTDPTDVIMTPTGPLLPLQPTEPNLPDDGAELTIAEILALSLPENYITKQQYYVKATVLDVTNSDIGDLLLTDGTNTITAHSTKNADGTVGYADMEDRPQTGDAVLLIGSIENANGTIHYLKAQIVSFTHADAPGSDSK